MVCDLLPLFGPILNVAATVVHLDYLPGRLPGTGHDKPDPREEFPSVPRITDPIAGPHGLLGLLKLMKGEPFGDVFIITHRKVGQVGHIGHFFQLVSVISAHYCWQFV